MLCWCTCVNGPANELPLHSQSSLGRKSLQSSPAPQLWSRHVNIREKSAICLHSLLINPGSGVINSPLLCKTFLKTLGFSIQVGEKAGCFWGAVTFLQLLTQRWCGAVGASGHSNHQETQLKEVWNWKPSWALLRREEAKWEVLCSKLIYWLFKYILLGLWKI